jgi:hypothetical protein
MVDELLLGILVLVNLGTLVPVGTSDARLSLWYLILVWVILLGCNGCTSPELLLLLLLRSDTIGWFALLFGPVGSGFWYGLMLSYLVDLFYLACAGISCCC